MEYNRGWRDCLLTLGAAVALASGGYLVTSIFDKLYTNTEAIAKQQKEIEANKYQLQVLREDYLIL